MKELDYLSVVVLNYNSYEDTVNCVDNIIRFRSGIHIVVVDNCSPDGSYITLVNKYREVSEVTVIQSNKNGGYSYGNNVGIKYAESNFHSKTIGILNPDIIVEDLDVFKKMCDALNRYSDLAIIGASTLSADGTYNPNNSGWLIPTGWQLVRWHFLKNDRKRGKPHWGKIDENVAQVDCVAGCFFLAKASALKSMGYLDENVFLYNEENILGIKCKEKGYIEGVILDKYYIHNHKQKKGEIIPFRKKINATANVYRSTRYLLRTYYSIVYLPPLAVMEMLNRIYLSLAYVRNLLKKGRGES